jgi:hypothetical protein
MESSYNPSTAHHRFLKDLQKALKNLPLLYCQGTPLSQNAATILPEGLLQNMSV